MQRYQVLLSVIVTGIITLGFVSCKGPEGPPGSDAILPDTEPPVVTLLEPAYGDTASQEFTMRAAALDNAGVEFVRFYLDGNEWINDSTIAVDSVQPYEYTFDLVEMQVPAGEHTAAARAYDYARNTELTPSVLFHYFGPIAYGSTPIRHYLDPATEDSLYIFFFHDTSDVEEHTFNVRFHPGRECIVTGAELFLADPADTEIEIDTTVRVVLWESNGVYPTIPTDSVDLDADELSAGEWNLFSFSDNEDTLSAGERFHISFYVPSPSDTTRIAIRATIQDDYAQVTYCHTGFYSDALGRFVTAQEADIYTRDAEKTLEFHVRAIVNYLEPESGTAALSPETVASSEQPKRSSR